jgi:putative transposase
LTNPGVRSPEGLRTLRPRPSPGLQVLTFGCDQTPLRCHQPEKPPALPEDHCAKFWLQVLTELRNRGVKDIFIACVDGLKGFPQAQVQLCIVHLVRASLNYVSWTLPCRDGGTGVTGGARVRCEMGWEVSDDCGVVATQLGTGDSVLRLPGRSAQDHHTTIAVESLNMSVRKALKPRSVFPVRKRP